MDLQWHEGTRDDLGLAGVAGGLPVVRAVGLRLCLSPGAGLSSGFAPRATVPPRVNPRGSGVAFFCLPSRCGLHYLPIAGAIYP